ncbi:MAG: restriction endonuclease subunit S [Comamonadaceae bacterium]|nr:restriction endonuclease subunit S [Comamonadaceae bacterium]
MSGEYSSLDEVAEVIDSLHKTPSYAGEGFPMVRVTDVKYGTLNLSNTLLVDETTYSEFSRRYKPSIGDVVITRVGTYGVTARVGEAIFCLGQNTAAIIPKSINSRYLYAALNSDFVRSQIEAGVVGSTQKTLSLKHIKALMIPRLGSIDEAEIAETIGALDDRITLLRETNATLEAIAQALFKSWFVDFDPVRAKLEGRAPEGMDEATAALFPDSFEESDLGLVPRGWRVLPIGDAVEAVGGATPDTKTPAYWEPAVHCWTTPKDLSGIATPVLLDTERKLSDQGLAKIGSGALPIGTLLLSSRAPIGYLALAQVPLAINQGYIAMPPGGLLPPLYLLFWCRQNMENIKGRANGSTFMEISKKAFRPIPALVPSPEIVHAFAVVAGTLFDRLIENEKQAQTLSTLRDTLLPRLISGQLRLPEAQAAAEEALE